MPLDAQRIFAREVHSDPRRSLFFGPIELVASDAVDPGISVNPYVGDPNLRHDPPRRPRRIERSRQRYVDLAGPDAGDLHLCSLRGGPGGGMPPGPTAHFVYPISVRALIANAIAASSEAPCTALANMFG